MDALNNMASTSVQGNGLMASYKLVRNESKEYGKQSHAKLHHQAPAQYMLNLLSHGAAYFAGFGLVHHLYPSISSGATLENLGHSIEKGICYIVDISNPGMQLCQFANVSGVIQDNAGVVLGKAHEIGLEMLVPALAVLTVSYVTWHHFNYLQEGPVREVKEDSSLVGEYLERVQDKTPNCSDNCWPTRSYQTL